MSESPPPEASPPLLGIAADLDEARGHPAFAEYMARCLYDPQVGYYATGQVVFGEGEHFWTYPQRLRPLFGWMVAEAALAILTELVASGQVPAEAPLTILELGAGNGDLARDALDYIAAAGGDARWQPLASRVRYVVGEVSSALRLRQEDKLRPHLDAGRAEVRAVDARTLDWHGPFYGLVVANELIDAFPCELLRLYGPQRDAHRVHVVPMNAHGSRPLPSALQPHAPDARAVALDEVWAKATASATSLAELEVPLALGWLQGRGEDGVVPPALGGYLDRLDPLVRDLHACKALPVDLCWAPALPAFVERLAALLHGPQRCGVALLVDYGGSSRHVLDPQASAPHLRVYGPDGGRAHTADVLRDPGRYDLTWDVDFTELGRLAEASGLAVRFFGHQSALEAPPIELWSKVAQRHLINARVLAGETNGVAATMQAYELVARFREAAGFRLMALGSPVAPFPAARFGPADPWDDEALVTLACHVDRAALGQVLAQLGVDEGVVDFLKPCGDVVADLSDRRSYRHRHAVLAALAERGWLRGAGQLAAAAAR